MRKSSRHNGNKLSILQYCIPAEALVDETIEHELTAAPERTNIRNSARSDVLNDVLSARIPAVPNHFQLVVSAEIIRIVLVVEV